MFRTVVIALSASSVEDEHDIALAKGCDGFLRKPFREADLFALMQTLLGVQYVYEDSQTQTMSVGAAPTADAGLTVSALAAIPDELVTQLEQALTICDPRMLFPLIERIREQRPDLADAVRKRVDNFEYGAVLAVITESKTMQASKLHIT